MMTSGQVLTFGFFVIDLFDLGATTFALVNVNESVGAEDRRDVVDYRSELIDLA